MHQLDNHFLYFLSTHILCTSHSIYLLKFLLRTLKADSVSESKVNPMYTWSVMYNVLADLHCSYKRIFSSLHRLCRRKLEQHVGTQGSYAQGVRQIISVLYLNCTPFYPFCIHTYIARNSEYVTHPFPAGTNPDFNPAKQAIDFLFVLLTQSVKALSSGDVSAWCILPMETLNIRFGDYCWK